MMYLVQWTLATPSQEVTPRIPIDFFLALQTTDEGTRTLPFSLSRHFSLDNIVEDEEFSAVPLTRSLVGKSLLRHNLGL